MLGGDCAAALEFYRSALGAKIEMQMTYDEMPDKMPPGVLVPGWEKKIMHCSFRIGETVLMASDGRSAEDKGKGVHLSLSLPTEADVKKAFAALSIGGEIEMPPSKTFWSPCFGMLTDRFGIGWLLGIAA